MNRNLHDDITAYLEQNGDTKIHSFSGFAYWQGEYSSNYPTKLIPMQLHKYPLSYVTEDAEDDVVDVRIVG